MVQNALKKFGELGSRYFRPYLTPKFSPPKRDGIINLMFGWFYSVQNMINKDRVTLMGPDLACAEWLLRNGASVRFKGTPNFVSDYNELMELEELPESKSFRVEEVRAIDCTVNGPGFLHFKDCEHVKRITIQKCLALGNSGLENLSNLKGSLQHLELASCYRITDKGLLSLSELSNLRMLLLKDLVSVKEREKCLEHLRKSLTDCEVRYSET